MNKSGLDIVITDSDENTKFKAIFLCKGFLCSEPYTPH